MLANRIVAAGAVLAMAVGSATAQTVIVPVGKPLPLLQIVEQPSKAKPPLRAKREAKMAKSWLAKAHKTVIAAKPKHRPVEIAAAPASAPPTTVAALPPPAPAIAPAPQPTTAFAGQSAEPPSGAIVVAGQTVQVAASPDDANALDLAANDQGDAATPMAAADPVAAQPTASAAPVVRAMVVAAVPEKAITVSQNATRVGSASWIAQVLAALAGAIAAAIAAWFLIGVTPRRTYG